MKNHEKTIVNVRKDSSIRRFPLSRKGIHERIKRFAMRKRALGGAWG
jgi:hypothetical protein